MAEPICGTCNGTGKVSHPAASSREGGEVECWDCGGSGVFGDPEETKALFVGPPDCPECGAQLRAGLLSDDMIFTGVSMTEKGLAIEGYHKPKKMWWCIDCAGVCVEDVLDEAVWDASRAKQDKETKEGDSDEIT